MTATRPKSVKTRLLLRMERSVDVDESQPPGGVEIRPYAPLRHHDAIRTVYAATFDDDPWPADWDEFAGFDPSGVFVAISGPTAIGFVISFRREDFGYISVVAVRPEHQRRGIARALIGRAARYLRTLHLERVRIDAFGDSPPAAAAYWSLGFRIYDIVLEHPNG